MKRLAASCILVLLLAGCHSAPTPGDASALTVDEKIDLIAATLVARDRGDEYEAMRLIARLEQVAPNDLTVARLKRDIEQARLAPPPAQTATAPVQTPQNLPAQRPTPAPVAAQPVPSAAPTVSIPNSQPLSAPSPVPLRSANQSQPIPTPANPVMPEVIDELPPGATPPPPPDPLNLALARVEDAGAAYAQSPNTVDRLMEYLEAQRTLARLYAERGDNLQAARTIDTMIRSLQSNVAQYISQLRDEREQYLIDEIESREGPRILHRR